MGCSCMGETYAMASLHPRNWTLLRKVATSGYNQSVEVGIRELKDNLSQYIRRIEAGERVVVTAHGRVVAELAPSVGTRTNGSHFERLIASGVITPPLESGDPLEACPEIRL